MSGVRARGKPDLGWVAGARRRLRVVSGAGIYDTDTIEKDVSAVVSVTYGIDA
jgi:hypothetical protein